MTDKVKQHFKDKQDTVPRKKWFLEQYPDVPAVIKDLSGADINAEWLKLFNADKRPRVALSRIQKRISRLATIRKGVVEQYIQMGAFLLDGIDFYRYNLVKSAFIADVLPGDWNGK